MPLLSRDPSDFLVCESWMLKKLAKVLLMYKINVK